MYFTLSQFIKAPFIVIVMTAAPLSTNQPLTASTRPCWGGNDCWMHLLPPWLIWSYRDDTYYTSLDYLVSLSTGRSWFKNQLQQVECCDGDFCHSKCVLGEQKENIIWWNNYWGIEDMWVRWFIQLWCYCSQTSGGCPIKTKVLAVCGILCSQCTRVTSLRFLEFSIAGHLNKHWKRTCKTWLKWFSCAHQHL